MVLATAGFHRQDDYNFHKYDGYLETPESAALKCIEELNSGDGKYPKKVSLYHFIEKTGRGTSQESEEAEPVRRSIKNMALGKTVPMDLGDAVSIQAVPASIVIKEFLYIRVKSGLCHDGGRPNPLFPLFL